VKAKQTSRSCFLSAPFGTDTRTLERELKKRGLSVTDGRTLAPGAPLIEEIRERISETDLVCVVGSVDLPASSAFEIGIAIGMAKQVVAFAPLGTALPNDLLGITYCSAALDDRLGIATFLDAFLAHGRTKRWGKAGEVTVPKLTKAQSRDLRRQLARVHGSAFEAAVRDLFDLAGYVASETVVTSDRGVDFAIWIDNLQHAFGNPILVEVKDHLDEWSVGHVEEALRSAMVRTRSRLGLLVYRATSHSAKRALVSRSWPLVLRLEAGDLIQLLERGTFESELIRRRNRVVHGVEES
jgi:Restriction endonuclease